MIRITQKMKSYYMNRAIQLAQKGEGYVNPNPMVGAVLVKDGKVVGEGWHQAFGEPHAEVNAFREAGEAAQGADLYVTLEPCSHHGKTPPCADLVVRKKVKRVFIGTADPNPLVAGYGIAKMKAAGISVETGIMENECRKINEKFFYFIQKKRPFVLLKAAVSLDGKIAAASGESQWISCQESREEVQRLRHEYAGIMVGIGTLMADNPRLTCRLPQGSNPTRIIVDSHLKIPETSYLVAHTKEAPVIVAAIEKEQTEKKKYLQNAGVQILNLPEKSGKVSLPHLMQELGNQGIDSILLEGGGELNFSMLEAGLVNKVRYYIAPKLIGGNMAPGSIRGSGIASLADAFVLENVSSRKSGNDICIEGYLKVDKGGEECSQEL